MPAELVPEPVVLGLALVQVGSLVILAITTRMTTLHHTQSMEIHQQLPVKIGDLDFGLVLLWVVWGLIF